MPDNVLTHSVPHVVFDEMIKCRPTVVIRSQTTGDEIVFVLPEAGNAVAKAKSSNPHRWPMQQWRGRSL
jgi:hypothetical protein